MNAHDRKARPLYSGVLRYFPDALLEVAHCSWKGNEQHNPGQPLHWAKEKSFDEPDALLRHLLHAGEFDTDGIRHSAKVAWRALAMLQRELEAAELTEDTLVPDAQGMVLLHTRKGYERVLLAEARLQVKACRLEEELGDVRKQLAEQRNLAVPNMLKQQAAEWIESVRGGCMADFSPGEDPGDEVMRLGLAAEVEKEKAPSPEGKRAYGERLGTWVPGLSRPDREPWQGR